MGLLARGKYSILEAVCRGFWSIAGADTDVQGETAGDRYQPDQESRRGGREKEEKGLLPKSLEKAFSLFLSKEWKFSWSHGFNIAVFFVACDFGGWTMLINLF